ncbi:MAG TPA: hypothetical protein VH062_00260 [Polyangiaceae bacterium]|nr:hypothetical protein [Polyangiaceae bacterium]
MAAPSALFGTNESDGTSPSRVIGQASDVVCIQCANPVEVDADASTDLPRRQLAASNHPAHRHDAHAETSSSFANVEESGGDLTAQIAEFVRDGL